MKTKYKNTIGDGLNAERLPYIIKEWQALFLWKKSKYSKYVRPFKSQYDTMHNAKITY